MDSSIDTNLDMRNSVKTQATKKIRDFM